MKKTALLILLLVLTASPAMAELKLKLGGEFLTAYDDNITYTHSNKVSDAIFKPSLVGGLIGSGKNHEEKLFVTLTQNIYANNGEFNNLAESILFDGKMELSPYDTIKLSEKFNHSEDPYTFEDAFGRTSGRYGQTTNALRTEYSRQVSQRWTSGVNFGVYNYAYSRSDISDSVQLNFGLNNEYEISPKNKLLLDYTLMHRAYEHDESSTSNTFSGGVRHFFTRQLYLDLKPGLSFIHDVNGDDKVKPRYEAILADDIDEVSTLKVSYLSDYGTSSYSQENFDSWRWSAAFKRQLTNRTALDLSAFFGKGKYKVSDISDRLSGLNAGVTYDLTRNASIYLDYAFQNTHSNVDSRSYSKNTVQTGFKLTY